MKKKIGLIAAALVLSLVVFPAAVFGASSSVSISAGNSIKVGDTVTVTVTYKGSSLGYVNGQMTYDNSKLQYVSGGSSTGDAGLVELKTYADDASGRLSFKVKFKAVGTGSVNLNLETLETQNLDGDQSMGTPSASKTVMVAAAEQTETTEKETASETPSSSVETTAAAPTESSGEVQNQQEAGNGLSYPLLSIIAAVLVLLIVLVAVKLGKRKTK